MSRARQWCPATWLDETVPQLCDDPSGFLVMGDEHGWSLRAPDHVDFGDYWKDPIVPGETVEFYYTEDRDSFEIEIAEDRSWTLTMGTIPQGEGVVFWTNRDPSTVTDTIAGTVDAAIFDHPALPVRLEIDAAFWSMRSYTFQFVLVEGKPLFVEIGERAPPLSPVEPAVAGAAQPELFS